MIKPAEIIFWCAISSWRWLVLVEISLEASNQFQDYLLLHKWVQFISTTLAGMNMNMNMNIFSWC
jgi:EamA domain-containing membrane protein RarD